MKNEKCKSQNKSFFKKEQKARKINKTSKRGFMVVLKDKWKRDPNCEGEIESLPSKGFGGIEKAVKEKAKEFGGVSTSKF